MLTAMRAHCSHTRFQRKCWLLTIRYESCESLSVETIALGLKEKC